MYKIEALNVFTPVTLLIAASDDMFDACKLYNNGIKRFEYYKFLQAYREEAMAMPVVRNNKFSELLHTLIVKCSSTHKMHIKDVEQKLADATGLKVDSVRGWHLRERIPNASTIELLVPTLHELGAFQTCKDVEQLLTYSGHPDPKKELVELPTKEKIDRALAYDELEALLPKIHTILHINGPEDYINSWTAIVQYAELDKLKAKIERIFSQLLYKQTKPEQLLNALSSTRFPVLEFTLLTPHFLALRGEFQLRIDLAMVSKAFAEAKGLDNYLVWLLADIIPWPLLVLKHTSDQLLVARAALGQVSRLSFVSPAVKCNSYAHSQAILAATYLRDTQMSQRERIYRAAECVKDALSWPISSRVHPSVLATILLVAGDLHMQKENYETAIQYYRESHEMDLAATEGKYPTIVGNQVWLVKAYIAAQKIAEAQTTMNDLITKTPDFCYGPLERKWVNSTQFKLAEIVGNRGTATPFFPEASMAMLDHTLVLPTVQ